MQDLDGDLSSEIDVRGPIHEAHAAAAEHGLEMITTVDDCPEKLGPVALLERAERGGSRVGAVSGHGSAPLCHFDGKRPNNARDYSAIRHATTCQPEPGCVGSLPFESPGSSVGRAAD